MDLHAKPAAPPFAAGGGDARLSRARDYARIAQALDYLATHHLEQPGLGTIAADPVKAATERVGATIAGMMRGGRAEVVKLKGKGRRHEGL